MGLKTRKKQADEQKGLFDALSGDKQQIDSPLAAPDNDTSTRDDYAESHQAGVMRAMVAYCSGRHRTSRSPKSLRKSITGRVGDFVEQSERQSNR